MTTEVIHIAVTPEEASQWRLPQSEGGHAFPGQRKIDKRNVERLKSEMELGTFEPTTQITFCVLPNGERHVVNGNHTLEAIIALGRPYQLCVAERFVANYSEVQSAYTRFDRQKNRTKNNHMDAWDITGLDKKLGNSGALTIILTSYERGDSLQAVSRAHAITPEDLKRGILRYSKPARLFYGVALGPKEEIHRFVNNASIAAIGVLTMQHKKGKTFWSTFAADNGLKDSHPAKALLNFLRDPRNQSNGGNRWWWVAATMIAWNEYVVGNHVIEPLDLDKVRTYGRESLRDSLKLK
jgi:hypothetical protein